MFRFATTIGLLVMLGVTSNQPGAIVGQEKKEKADTSSIEKVLAAWAAPGAPDARGDERHSRDNPNPTSQAYTVKKPFKEVWEHYAAKCGEKEPYTPGLNLRSAGGKDSVRYLLTLTQSATATEKAYSRFAIHGDGFWLVVVIASPDAKGQETRVDLVGGAK